MCRILKKDLFKVKLVTDQKGGYQSLERRRREREDMIKGYKLPADK